MQAAIDDICTRLPHICAMRHVCGASMQARCPLPAAWAARCVCGQAPACMGVTAHDARGHRRM
eukprot:353751-Chlamydomonas_euryale.AAC.6